ncbi:MAG: squalene/phytoene synthase family protein [Dehalococcoidia bacterium]|nr:squalene/phytoene synthase family protein [Dehalococcoidia bacterium]|tara:strand:- start:2110 stop:3012 length:903 start_codon:yes stop_codon:yes gene_type:complete
MKKLIFNYTKKNFSYQESIKICYEVIHQNYENFPIYMFFLNKDMMNDFASIYAFSRGVDFIGDELKSDEVDKALQIWRSELDLAFDGNPSNPIFIALSKTINKYKLEIEPFRRLIKANEMDQYITKYNSWNDIFSYCDHSANPVGAIVLRILGYTENSNIKFSNKICTGLQITNFIQDIKVDHYKNRTYIPQNLLKKHNLDFSSINKVTKNNINFLSKFDNLLADLIQENQRLYDEGRILIKNLSKKHAIIINIFILSGQTILNKIRNQKSNILFKKPRTNKLEKLYIIIKATVSVLLKR